MPNPYKTNQRSVNVQSVAPTLDLDPSAGPEREAALPKPELTDSVPTGSMKEVLDWVGDDRKRAKAAISAEQHSERIRTSLIDRLKKVSGK